MAVLVRLDLRAKRMNQHRFHTGKVRRHSRLPGSHCCREVVYAEQLDEIGFPTGIDILSVQVHEVRARECDTGSGQHVGLNGQIIDMYSFDLCCGFDFDQSPRRPAGTAVGDSFEDIHSNQHLLKSKGAFKDGGDGGIREELSGGTQSFGRLPVTGLDQDSPCESPSGAGTDFRSGIQDRLHGIIGECGKFGGMNVEIETFMTLQAGKKF